MKYINKIFAAGCLALGLGLGATSCINDLDVMPESSTQRMGTDIEGDPDQYLPAMLSKCYSVLAVSGQAGPGGDADLKGLDGGTSCWSRAIYMLNEFPTDEALWIWKDEGVVDLVTGTWTNGNTNIYGTYSRLYVAIAICNDFIRNVNSMGLEMSNPTTMFCAKQYILEARAIRALNYWYVLDLFGNGGWVDETTEYGVAATPIKRADLYDKLVAELKDIISQWPNEKPVYGRVGLDGVKALLAKVYLNAKVYTNGAVDGYGDCLTLCDEIIANHKGGGFQGSGLANHYLALFAADNHRYVQGSLEPAAGEDEILWNIPYDYTSTQSYGGTTFLIGATVATNSKDDPFTMNCLDYGLNQSWKCIHARAEFSDKFRESNDVRDDFWSKEENGFTKLNTEFSTFNSGYANVKFTNLRTKADGTFALKDPTLPAVISNIADEAKEYNTRDFADTDFPIFRLADIYLMKAECYVMGGKGSASEALQAANYVRERAGAKAWTSLTEEGLLDERARELYHENHRRTDLVRFNRFVRNYTWSWKGNVLEGANLGSHMNVFPIPANVIAAQPEFASIQNPGY